MWSSEPYLFYKYTFFIGIKSICRRTNNNRHAKIGMKEFKFISHCYKQYKNYQTLKTNNLLVASLLNLKCLATWQKAYFVSFKMIENENKNLHLTFLIELFLISTGKIEVFRN